MNGRFQYLCVIFGLAATAAVAQSNTNDFDLPPQALAESLRAVASTTHINVLFDTKKLAERRAPALKGRVSADEALEKLLEGSGLTYRFLDDKTVVLTAEEEQGGASTRSSGLDRRAAGEVNLAQESGSSSTVPAESGQLEEIVVTAQKRKERLIDVPQSITVLSADTLDKLGATQLRDIANTIPGLTLSSQGVGYNQVSLRGITTGVDVAPTVGIYVDEVPYGSSSSFAFGGQLGLDVALFDLDRIEVLRGPQGTLYGASTAGGLIKYVNRQPELTRFEGSAKAGVADTRDGGVSYNGSTAVNIPLFDGKAAVRTSGFFSHDGGYIDNVVLDQKDIDRADVYGGRIDMLFAPTDALKIRINGFAQDISREGQIAANYTVSGTPVNGSLDERRFFAEPFDQQFRLLGGTLTYDFGRADLTSVSSYQTAAADTVLDLTTTFLPVLNFLGYTSYSAVGIQRSFDTDKFTQEIRLASKGSAPFEWVLGAFYTHEDSENAQKLVMNDLAGQPASDNLLTVSGPSSYEEYAAFGTLTYSLTRKLDVSGGLRFAHNDQATSNIGSGPFGSSNLPVKKSDDVSTYLANARYRPNEHTNVFFRYATGYRPGGPNYVGLNPATGLPKENGFDSDRLKSYEIGVKAETAGRRFGIEAATYYIDWKDFQILVNNTGFGEIGNARGGAISRGEELTLTARPAEGLTLLGAFTYQDSYLAEEELKLTGSNGEHGAKGEQMPNVAHFTAALNVDYQLPSVSGLRPTVGSTLRRVGERKAEFGQSARRLPEYTIADLRIGVPLGGIDLQLYAHNLFDKRAQIAQAVGGVFILQPRTFGITATTRF
jgi:outer membrane receptor protein involved in Fe transport